MIKKYYVRMIIMTIIINSACFVFLIKANGLKNQGYCIDEILFSKNITPGASVKLYISLFPKEKNNYTLSIQLITWTDINNDFKYSDPGEEIIHKKIFIKDNEKGKDEEPAKNEIEVTIFSVPKDLILAPQKYTAIIECNSDRKIVSKNLSDRQKYKLISKKKFHFNDLLNIPYEVAKGLHAIKDALRENINEYLFRENNYTEIQSLYIYNILTKKEQKVLSNKEMVIMSPNWAFDNQKITFVTYNKSNYRIAWTDTHKNSPSINYLTTGAKDIDPYWLPNDDHIIFLRNHQLHIVSLRDNQISEIDRTLYITKILGVYKGNEIQIIYETMNKYDPNNKEIHMIGLNHQFKPISFSKLVYDPMWFFITSISAHNGQLAYTNKGKIYLISMEEENMIQLFGDDKYHYYDPSWSPNGYIFVFTTDRP